MSSSSSSPSLLSSSSSSLNNIDDYARQVTPLSCEREPIHIVNRIQPCGTLLVVDSNLQIVQCSTNAVDMMLPEEKKKLLFELTKNYYTEEGENKNYNDNNNDLLVTPHDDDGNNNDGSSSVEEKRARLQLLLDAIIGAPLSLLLQVEAVDQVRAVVRGASASLSSSSSKNTNDGNNQHQQGSDGSSSSGNNNNNIITDKGAVRTFLIRTQGALSIGRKSCGITQSGEHFLLEIEDSDLHAGTNNIGGGSSTTSTQQQQQQQAAAAAANAAEGEEDTMLFMQSIAHDLRKCWSIEEMAGLVCSRIMSETPYDRGMVYRFDPSDDSGEVIYETTRWDARRCCREDSFLGLRFPASDIPRQARELFMKNTLRFVYDVQGKDYGLYPSKISGGMMGGGGEESEKYTDLSMCRLRGSSYIHLEYLRNMQVTSSLVIAIIVNKRLWGLYSFHGYRHPIRPSARTRFLCEMASVMTCEYHIYV